MSDSWTFWNNECVAHSGQCQWPKDQVTHGPVEPNCPDPEQHHAFVSRMEAKQVTPAETPTECRLINDPKGVTTCATHHALFPEPCTESFLELADARLAEKDARIARSEKERDEARAENESAQAAWETRYSILVAALVSIAGSDTIGVHSEYIRMKAEARRVLEVKP